MGKPSPDALPNALAYKSNDISAPHLLCSDTNQMPQIDLGKGCSLLLHKRADGGGVQSCRDGMHICFFQSVPSSKSPEQRTTPPTPCHRKQALDSPAAFWNVTVGCLDLECHPWGHSQVFSGTSCWPAQLLLAWPFTKTRWCVAFCWYSEHIASHKCFSRVTLQASSSRKYQVVISDLHWRLPCDV